MSRELVYSGRRAARAQLVQALYQWQISNNQCVGHALFCSDENGRMFKGCDNTYFKRVWKGLLTSIEAVDHQLTTAVDRPIDSLTPIERAVLRLGVYELIYEPDVPYKVVINEALELSKLYGTTEGFRYVNGILDKLVGTIRRNELGRAL